MSGVLALGPKAKTESSFGLSGCRELVVIDPLVLDAERLKQRDRGLHHGRRTADVGVRAGEGPPQALDHVGDEADLPAPLLVRESRDVGEVGQLLRYRGQLILEAEVALPAGAVEERCLAVDAALGHGAE